MRIIFYDSYARYYPSCPREVPDDILSIDHCMRIHGMNLLDMDAKGGMTPAQVALNLEREFDYSKLKGEQESVRIINNQIKKYNELSRM